MNPMQKTWLQFYEETYKDSAEPAKIFHIGYHKTATTFVQKSILPQLSQDLSRDIFSYEGISGHRFKDNLQCGNFIKNINPEAKIIVTIRSQVTMFPSYYWLYVKEGGTLSLEDFIEECMREGRFDYYALYQSLTKDIDINNIAFIPFELLKSDKSKFLNHYLDFALGHAPKEINYDYKVAPHKNHSPKLLAVQIVRLANKIAGNNTKLQNLRGFIAKRTGWIEKLCFNPQKQVQDVMTPDLQDKISHHYKKSNQLLQEKLEWDLKELGYPCKTAILQFT